MGAQGKLDKDALSEVCFAHERGRTPAQRRHVRSCACPVPFEGLPDRPPGERQHPALTSSTAPIAYTVCPMGVLGLSPNSLTIDAASGWIGSNKNVSPSSGLGAHGRPPPSIASMIASPSARAVPSTVADTIAGRAARTDTRHVVRQRLTPSAIEPSRHAGGTAASAPAVSAIMIGRIITVSTSVAVSRFSPLSCTTYSTDSLRPVLISPLTHGASSSRPTSP